MITGWRVDYVAKGIFAWILFITGLLSITVRDSNSTFFQVGPNNDLHIFGITINTPLRYTIVVAYTMCSTVIRTLQQEVLMPWIIQSIQNGKEKNEYVQTHAYHVVLVDVTYRWFDWFMYMNILLSQIDMTVIEMAGNLVTSYYMTKYYLAHSKKNVIQHSNSNAVLLELTPLSNQDGHYEESNTKSDVDDVGNTLRHAERGGEAAVSTVRP